MQSCKSKNNCILICFCTEKVELRLIRVFRQETFRVQAKENITNVCAFKFRQIHFCLFLLLQENFYIWTGLNSDVRYFFIIKVNNKCMNITFFYKKEKYNITTNCQFSIQIQNLKVEYN